MAMQQNYYADFSATGSTVDPAEVAKFSELSEEWWDPRSHEMRCGRPGPGAQLIRFLFGFPFSSVHWSQGGGENAGPIPAHSFPLLKELAS
jgi:hypothetical protein